jgi:hypothetical protein
MRLEVVGIYDRGDLSKERLHLRATMGINLSFYVVLDSFRLTETTVRALQTTCYWFSNKAVPTGFNVVLYTRSGVSTEEKKLEESYLFLFRGLVAPLYTDSKALPVVLELIDWKAKV